MLLIGRLRCCAFGFSAALVVLSSASIALAAEPECRVSEDAFEFEPYLPKTLQALETGTEMTVVAVGGASTEGRAAGGPDASWAARFAEELKRRFPGTNIKLELLATPRQTAAQMAARFPRDVIPRRPTLVIWETGTVDAVRGTDIDEFRTTLQEGIDQLRPSGTEIVLMDMQYSRLSHAIDYFNRYVVLMRGIADVNDIPLFPRHKIMYEWAEMGLFQSAEPNAEARRAVADKLYRCLGTAVADFVTRRPQAPSSQQ